MVSVTDVFSRDQRSAIMARVKGADTGPELRVRRLAHRLGYRFRLYRADLPGTPDLVFPRRRIALFVPRLLLAPAS
jgi:DNA mismatch endonuclease, patch repair protein